MEPRRATGNYSFDGYLRTGRLIRIDARWGPREVKFNPNHDPENGQFTFKDGVSGGASMSRPPTIPRPKSGKEDPRVVADERARKERDSAFDPRNPKNYTAYSVKPGDSLSKIARLRKGLTVEDAAWLNQIDPAKPLQIGQELKLPNQDFLDAGRDTKNKFLALAYYMNAHGGQLPPNVAHPPSLAAQTLDRSTWHGIDKNGYHFDLDPLDRTREMQGQLTLATASARSRSSQRTAGGSDRLTGDDGGHYIAARFNGPSDAFNHFAQDANFNRGAYRTVENDWAAAIRANYKVRVDILPSYTDFSKRPDHLTVTWYIGNMRFRRELPNRRGGK